MQKTTPTPAPTHAINAPSVLATAMILNLPFHPLVKLKNSRSLLLFFCFITTKKKLIQMLSRNKNKIPFSAFLFAFYILFYRFSGRENLLNPSNKTEREAKAGAGNSLSFIKGETECFRFEKSYE